MKRYVIKRPAGSQMPDRLARFREELNEEQLAVATALAGSALVIAGAGSGKTRAITYRVAYLVEHGVAPARVMLATFTNRAASGGRQLTHGRQNHVCTKSQVSSGNQTSFHRRRV